MSKDFPERMSEYEVAVFSYLTDQEQLDRVTITHEQWFKWALLLKNIHLFPADVQAKYIAHKPLLKSVLFMLDAISNLIDGNQASDITRTQAIVEPDIYPGFVAEHTDDQLHIDYCRLYLRYHVLTNQEIPLDILVENYKEQGKHHGLIAESFIGNHEASDAMILESQASLDSYQKAFKSNEENNDIAKKLSNRQVSEIFIGIAKLYFETTKSLYAKKPLLETQYLLAGSLEEYLKAKITLQNNIEYASSTSYKCFEFSLDSNSKNQLADTKFTDQEVSDIYVEKGLAATYNGSLILATMQFQKAVNFNPSNVTALIYLADSYIDGNYEGAKDEGAVDKVRKYIEALMLLKKAEEIDPSTSPTTNNLKASALLNIKKVQEDNKGEESKNQEASAIANEASAKTSEEPENPNLLQNSKDESLALPSNAEDWYNLAVNLKSSGNIYAGLQAISQAVMLKPDYVKAYILKAILHSTYGAQMMGDRASLANIKELVNKEYTQTISCFEWALKYDSEISDPNYSKISNNLLNTIYIQMGYAHKGTNEINQAIECFLAAKNINNQNIEPLIALTEIYIINFPDDIAKNEEVKTFIEQAKIINEGFKTNNPNKYDPNLSKTCEIYIAQANKNLHLDEASIKAEKDEEASNIAIKIQEKEPEELDSSQGAYVLQDAGTDLGGETPADPDSTSV